MAFLYPEFNKDGIKKICSASGKNRDMLMDICVVRMSAGTRRRFVRADKEICILLTEGEVVLSCGSLKERAFRTDVFADLPVCMHACKGCTVSVSAITDCEVIYVATENERVFPAKFYSKEDVIRSVSCEGLWENTAVRDVNTLFDYSNAPYSNLVVGEVLARQGRWWSYLPHYHPQPEVYYYKLPTPEGFGACFIGEEAHTIKDGSAGCFPGGKTHVQVTAPGYPMYCCWIIRHLDGDPWDKTRIVDARFRHWEE